LKFGAAEKREIAGAKNQPQAGEKKCGTCHNWKDEGRRMKAEVAEIQAFRLPPSSFLLWMWHVPHFESRSVSGLRMTKKAMDLPVPIAACGTLSKV
jgi:hypothetical protein